jgi:GNAT superfamily N-acetyltransferase
LAGERPVGFARRRNGWFSWQMNSMECTRSGVARDVDFSSLPLRNRLRIIIPAVDFFESTGRMALGSRLRRLSETITRDAARVHRQYGAPIHPKWFPILFVLGDGSEKTITGIASEIGHSHVSVSRMVREMIRHGFVVEHTAPKDRRQTRVRLSPKGRQARARMDDQITDVGRAVDEASAHTRHDLWEALGEWEYLLREKSLFARVLEQKKRRETRQIRVVDYEARHHADFRRLNEAWITRYFAIEDSDRTALDAPQTSILDRGGHILVALADDTVVGVCALTKMDAHTYELAKMAVAEEVRGQGIGSLLGHAALDRAREAGATRVYLESNTRLKPAIELYRKLGFRKIVGAPSAYARCNIQMEVLLTPG